jgi:hypothetical protein
MRKIPWKSPGVAIAAGGLVAAAVVPALASVGNSSPPIHLAITMGNNGKISARGAAVTIPFSVECPADSYDAYVNVSVSEKSGNGVASGYGGQGVVCTGLAQKVSVYVQAFGKPFKKGSASVSASIADDSPEFGYNFLPINGTITLK